MNFQAIYNFSLLPYAKINDIFSPWKLFIVWTPNKCTRIGVSTHSAVCERRHNTHQQILVDNTFYVDQHYPLFFRLKNMWKHRNFCTPCTSCNEVIPSNLIPPSYRCLPHWPLNNGMIKCNDSQVQKWCSLCPPP